MTAPRIDSSSVLEQAFLRDREVWDACARTYERQIVGGHPDVTAYEEFEEDLLDRIALFLAAEQGIPFKLFDVGCGSARLHQRLGLRIADETKLPEPDAANVRAMRGKSSRNSYEPHLAQMLQRIEGLDFSKEMIQIAGEKLEQCGLGPLIGNRLQLLQGSAFDLKPMDPEPLPVLASVCNSIGVMQGPEGASQLFASLRRAVERAGGIAILSAYRKAAVGSHALGNYETTMDVCGQPRWLKPATYAGPEHVQVPWGYKRAYSSDSTVTVDVLNKEGNALTEGHRLRRDPEAVQETIATGFIQTHTDYQSYWYSMDQFAAWIEQHWSGLHSYHLAGCDLDALRGAPCQLAILDPQKLLLPLVERWGCEQ